MTMAGSHFFVCANFVCANVMLVEVAEAVLRNNLSTISSTIFQFQRLCFDHANAHAALNAADVARFVACFFCTRSLAQSGSASKSFEEPFNRSFCKRVGCHAFS
jgi:hypothetical protein